MLKSEQGANLRVNIVSDSGEYAKIWFQSKSEHWEFIKRHLPDMALLLTKSGVKFQPPVLEVKKDWLLNLPDITIIQ